GRGRRGRAGGVLRLGLVRPALSFRKRARARGRAAVTWRMSRRGPGGSGAVRGMSGPRGEFLGDADRARLAASFEGQVLAGVRGTAVVATGGAAAAAAVGTQGGGEDRGRRGQILEAVLRHAEDDGGAVGGAHGASGARVSSRRRTIGMVQNRGTPAVESCATNHDRKSRCLKHLMDCIALRAHTQLPSGGTLGAGVLNHAGPGPPRPAGPPAPRRRAWRG